MSKLRKMKVKIVPAGDDQNLDFWLKKTPEERVGAVEFLRSQYYALAGYKDTPRLVRSVTIREREQK